jgi:heat shock protein beta
MILNFVIVQPENPAEFGARVYEMMGLALAGKNNAQAKEKVEGQGQKQTEEPSSDASETPSEVVEASEVITENDPWQS